MGRFRKIHRYPSFQNERDLRNFHISLLHSLALPCIAEGDFYGLNWSNMETPGYGRASGDSVSGHWLYAFLKHDRKSGQTALIICNLSPSEESSDISVSIPPNAWEWCGIRHDFLYFIDALNISLPFTCTKSLTETEGISLRIPHGKASILLVTKSLPPSERLDRLSFES